jgi:transglutaminase-like putative cysteine protease
MEVTGTARPAEGSTAAVRIVLVADPGDGHHRTIHLQKPQETGEPLDVLWRRLIRDWSPLDGGIWSPSFERLRRSLVTDGADLAWGRRNRLFDEIARPDGLDQPWVRERLRALAETDPMLLVDGLLHSHPRVRIGCVEVLDPLSVAEPARARLWAHALQDPDPAVRYRVAGRVATSPGLAGETLGRVFDTDSDEARNAGFQLLAALPPAPRAELLLATFGRLEQLPVKTRPFLATLLARWSRSEEALRALHRTWRKSREGELHDAVLRGLLEQGHPEALAAARERLATPFENTPPSLTAATRALVLHLSRAEERTLRLLVGALEGAASETASGGPGSELRKEIEESRKVLSGLLDHLASLPEDAAPAEECATLAGRPAAPWVTERQIACGCPVAGPSELVRLSLPLPGGFGASLLEMLERFQVDSPLHHEIFHTVLGRLLEGLGHWAGDPVSMTSTGLDLSAPLRLSWWPAATTGDPAAAPGGFHLTVRAGDSDRLLESLLRVSTGPWDLSELVDGLLAVQALPLLPAVLLSQWEEERELRNGESTASSTAVPPSRYVAVATEPLPSGASGSTLWELEIDDGGEASWDVTRFGQRGDRLSLVRGEPARLSPVEAELLLGEAEQRDPPRSDRGSLLEVDLTGLLRQLEEEAGDEGDPGAIPPGLKLSTRTELGSFGIATTLELSGLAETWLTAAVNGPAHGLRAPSVLLPGHCFLWLSLSFDPAALKAVLETESAAVVAALGEEHGAQLRAAADFLRGEAGLALVGVPEPVAGDAQEVWERHVVVYFSVEPGAADRFLRSTGGRPEKIGDLRLHRWEDRVAARIGGFLVVGADPEILGMLGKEPFLASSPAHREVLTRVPGAVAVFAGFDTERLASTLRGSLEERGDLGPSVLVVEVLRALGRIGAWVRREEGLLVGELSIAPHWQPETVRGRARELSGYVGFTSSSIGTDGLASASATGEPYAELELSLHLPRDVPDPGLAWAHERIIQEWIGPHEYRFVSRSGVPLPERSPVRLPITGTELLPYLRNEHNLSLHVDAVRELGETVRGGETDPARIVRAIVDWAHESLEYSIIRRSTSVEEILATRQADCTEFTRLTIALARSLGIPARPVSGVHVGRDAAILHQWAEVYLDRWYEIDPTFGIVELPASHLRFPIVDGNFLASLPGSRFKVQGALGRDGGWTRRIASGDGAARSGSAKIAVDRDRVLIDYPLAEPTLENRTLVSTDGGQTFAPLSTTTLRGDLVAILGGHGRLLRLHHEEAGPEGPGALFYELTESGDWKPVQWPEGLPDRGLVTELGLHADGYLALIESPAPRLFSLDPALGHARELPLPASAEGERLLATEGGALAHTVPGTGVYLYRWEDGRWQPPTLLEGTAALTARELRAGGDRIEVVVADAAADGAPRILFTLEGGSQSKRTVPSPPPGLLAATTAQGSTWTFWSDATGQFLTRRFLTRQTLENPGPVHDAVAGEEGDR